MTRMTSFVPTLAGFAVAVAATVFLVVDAPASEPYASAGAAAYRCDPIAFFAARKPVERATNRKAGYEADSQADDGAGAKTGPAHPASI
jgi:hypothetical protein